MVIATTTGGPEDDDDPVFAPWDGRRVPMTLIGGYLGAGKTTTINSLLARATSPIAVLVNDVGEINIDAKLIARRHGDTIELTDGCVCCSLSEGFLVAIKSIQDRPVPPDHVIVELSGVADPTQVTPWAAVPGFRLDGVVVLVDAEQFHENETDEFVGPQIRHQIQSADLIVLTKLDLADAATTARVRDRLDELAPRTPVVDSTDVDATAGLLSLGARHDGGFTSVPAPSLFDQHIVDTQPMPSPIDRADLDALVRDLPDDVLRAKGVAVTSDGTYLLVQVVGRRRTVTELPNAEWQGATDLVVIRRSSAP